MNTITCTERAAKTPSRASLNNQLPFTAAIYDSDPYSFDSETDGYMDGGLPSAKQVNVSEPSEEEFFDNTPKDDFFSWLFETFKHVTDIGEDALAIIRERMNQVYEQTPQFIKQHLDGDESWFDFIANHVENLILFLLDLRNSTDNLSAGLALMRYFKTFFGKASVCRKLQRFVMNRMEELSNGNGLINQGGFFDIFRMISANWKTFRNSKFLETFSTFVGYLVCIPVFSNMGLDVVAKQGGIKVFMRTYEKQPISFGLHFFDSVFEFLEALFNKGYNLLHCDNFNDVCIALSCDDMALGNLMSHINELSDEYDDFVIGQYTRSFEYFSRDVYDTLERGRGYLKQGNKAVGPALGFLVEPLAKLEKISSSLRSSSITLAPRKAPCSFLLYGDSGIGKTYLTKLIFYHFGFVYNKLNPTDQLSMDITNIYTKNWKDEYWSAFKSFMWCIRLDDISQFKPDKVQGCDPTLEETISIINEVPYVTAQASLEDKGKIALKPKLCIATTNVSNLNAHAYFNYPKAVFRRFRHMIEPVVKEQYRDGNTGALDTSKLQFTPGSYCDYWDFHIYEGDFSHPSKPGWRKIGKTLTSMHEFLQYIAKRVHTHLQEKAEVTKAVEDLPEAHAQVCDICFGDKATCSKNGCMPEFVEQGFSFENTPLMHLLLFWVRIKCFIFGIREKYAVLEDIAAHHFHTCVVYFFAHSYNPYHWDWRGLCLSGGSKLLWLGTHVGFSIKWYYICNGLYMAHMIKRHKMRTWLGFVRVDKIRQRIASIKQSQFYLLISTLAMSVVGIFIVSKAWNWFFKQKAEEPPSLVKAQGTKPVKLPNERENVWYNDNINAEIFDIGIAGRSLNGVPIKQFLETASNNVVRFSVSQDNARYIEGTMFCVAGNLYVTSAHYFDKTAIIPDTIHVRDSSTMQWDSSTKCKFSESMMYRPDHRDIVFLYLPNTINAKKNLCNYFPKKQNAGFKGTGYYITRSSDFTRQFVSLLNITNQQTYFGPSAPYNIDGARNLWRGVASKGSTTQGDCGAPLILQTPSGPCIVGLHIGIEDIGANKTPIVAEMLFEEDILSAFKHFDAPNIGCSQPNLACSTKTIKRVGVHSKSPVRFLEQGCRAYILGGLDIGYINHRSKVGKTLICNEVISEPPPFGPPITVLHGRPEMKHWKPKFKALQDSVIKQDAMDFGILRHVADCYLNDVMSRLGDEDFSQLHPYDLDTAINGYPGIAYVDKMKRNTSAGFPWNQPKRHFLVDLPPDEIHQDPVDVTPEIKERIADIVKSYMLGNRAHCVFNAHLKDEPTSLSKVTDKKTRVFCGAPIDFTLVVRQYLLSVIRLIQNNRFVFECAPGTVCQSLEWNEIYDFLTTHGEFNIIAGDYSAFDKSMSSMLIREAFRIIKCLCRKGAYTEWDLRVIDGITMDISDPHVNFFGTELILSGTNPSGHPLTVVINSIVNSLYMRYCYYHLNPNMECVSFQRNVKLMTYGDDNIMGVDRKKAPWFNHTTIVDSLASIGVGYTMADKSQKSVPYIHISEASFLKRTFRWDPNVSAVLCPIEHKSIVKMLTMCLRNKTWEPIAHAHAVLQTAASEYWFYGKVVYESQCEYLLQFYLKPFKEYTVGRYLADNVLFGKEEDCIYTALFPNRLYVPNVTMWDIFPTWDVVHEEFMDRSKRLGCVDGYIIPPCD